MLICLQIPTTFCIGERTVVCSKSIEPLVHKNTFIHIEQIYSNLLQNSPLGNAHTYPSGPAIVGNTSGTHLLEWC
jgi:hypothetical protein